MKKLTLILCLLIVISSIAGCSKPPEDILHNGFDVEITEIDEKKQIIYVSDKTGRFDETFAIDCSELTGKGKLIYVNYKTQHLSNIELKDLKVGDSLVLSVYDSQLEQTVNGPIKVEQIQLGTQRS